VSMAAGEWISVKSQAELFAGILKDLKQLIKEDRVLLTDQIATSLSTNGYNKKTAQTASSEIARSDANLTDVYAREVMGFNAEELGSPWVAAGSSLALFTLGAFAPLVPWFFTGNIKAVWLSVILTGIGGLIVGGYIGLSSGRNIYFAAARQLGIIILASVVTYGVGYVFGVNTH
jgi:VIT1/CCC1 family predicted Fe2+/Mn2+ transporter